MRHIVRYHRLLTDLVDVSVHHAAGQLTVRLDNAQKDHWRVDEFAAAIVVRVVRARFGREVSPVRVQLAVDAPSAAPAYRRYFKCPVQQRAPASEVTFAIDMPATPQVAHRPVADRIEALLDAAARDLQSKTTWSRQVHAAVLRAPADHMTSIEHIAAQFHVSERTLQRHLAGENTTFRDIVDNARKDLALRLVREGVLTLTQTADALGFQSSSAFSRSFRRWYGMTPTQAREPSAAPGGQPATRSAP